jgi:NAD(P)-dependent dehydrogenase (short-subunit alcohol dehydrogenase family)
LTVELGGRGIRVVGVTPCMVTPSPSPARSPLGRSALPDDVARVVAFLASDAALFVAGVTVPVDAASCAG